MSDIIILPEEHLRYISHESNGEALIIHIESTNTEATCPYCGIVSRKIHSRYTRILQDLPIQGRKIKLYLNNKKYFCINTECGKRTFAEQFGFFEPNSVRTKRLQEEILRVSIIQSSISASKYLRNSVADVCKSTICNLLKKGL